MYFNNNMKSMCHHHPDKLLVIDLSITINVSFPDHLINFFIGQFFPKCGHDLSEFSSRDELVPIPVEDFESFPQLFLSISVLDFPGHQSKELWEINGSISVSINFIDHVLKFCFSWILTKRSHDSSKLFCCDGSISILVEKCKSFLEFRNLLLCKLFRCHFNVLFD